MQNHNKAFGCALRELRIERNKTQETLGFDAGLDRTYISMLELGQSSPTLDTIMMLCRALGISFVEFAFRCDSHLSEQAPSTSHPNE